MTDDELQAKFEKRFPHLNLSKDHYGNYYIVETLGYWWGWQAAHASRDAEVRSLIRKYEKVSMYENGGLYSNIIDDLEELLGK